MKPTSAWLHRTHFLSPPITACSLFLFGIATIHAIHFPLLASAEHMSIVTHTSFII